MDSQVNFYDPSEFGFPEGSPIFDYAPETRKLINEASTRIRGQESYHRYWERGLNDAEREQLGGDLEACYATTPKIAKLVCGLRESSIEQAVVEIAYELEFLTLQSYSRLIQIVTGSSMGLPTSELRPVPSWDRQSGRLEYCGELCREIRVARATLIVAVLDSFQQGDWPPCVEYESDSPDPQRIHDAVANLNKKLDQIGFRVNGDRICWESRIS